MSSAWLDSRCKTSSLPAICDQRGSGCSQGPFYYVIGSNHPSPCLLFLICFRTWRSESAWGGFCEWTATPRCSPPKDSGTCPSRCQALRHLQAASGQPWLCQQNSWQVKAPAPGLPQCFKERSKRHPQLLKVPVSTVRDYGSILLRTLESLQSFEIILFKVAVNPLFSVTCGIGWLSGGTTYFSKVWWIILKNPIVRGYWEFSPNLLGELEVKGLAEGLGVDGTIGYWIQPELIVSFSSYFSFSLWCRAMYVLSDCLPLSCIDRL